MNAEAVLFIRNDKGEFPVFDGRLNQGVRPDDGIRFAAADGLQGFSPFGSFHAWKRSRTAKSPSVTSSTHENRQANPERY